MTKPSTPMTTAPSEGRRGHSLGFAIAAILVAVVATAYGIAFLAPR